MFQGFVGRNSSNTLYQTLIEVGAGAEIPKFATDIIFLARSKDEAALRASVNAVYEIAEQIAGSGEFLMFPSATGLASTTPGEYYVYAYTSEPEVEDTLWKDCFYIGKGNTNRWTDHVYDRANKAANGIQPEGKKEGAIQKWIDTLPDLSREDLVKKAAGALVRKVGAWRGEYAEVQSFAVEYFLIAHYLGPHAIANETGGNMKNGNVYALARPAVFDQENVIHKAYWEGAVGEFCKVPQTKKDRSLWKPALLLLHAEKLIDELDARLASVGITPHDMQSNGKLSPEMMLLPHCQVDGSSDATINYSMPSQSPYRLQLKLSATEDEVRINMRPQKPGALAKREFWKYIDNLVLEDCVIFGHRICNGHLRALYGQHDPIKDRNSKPFFKPFAQNAVGDVSPYFDIANLDQRSDASTTNWIEGEISLTLIEAMVMIFDVFRDLDAESKIEMSA